MKSTKITYRKCIGCNEMKNRFDLIRIVKSPDGSVFIDKGQKADGRGAYLCKNKDCLDKAIKRKAFNRALKAGVDAVVIDNLYTEIENGSR